MRMLHASPPIRRLFVVADLLPASPSLFCFPHRGFERVELRCPRELDPRPSWTLGDVLAELDALDATRRAAPPTPLKQPPDW